MTEKEDSEPWWLSMSENEFLETFHVSLKTFTALQAEIDDANGIENEELDKNLLAILWFLTNSRPPKNIEVLFQLKNVNDVLKITLNRIIKLAVRYIVWPDENEAETIEKLFILKYGLPSVVGVLGSLHVDVCVDGCNKKNIYYNNVTNKHTVVLQVVSDCNLLLRDVCTGCPGGSKNSDVLETSPLYRQLIDDDSFLVKKNWCLLGGTELPTLNTLLVPYKNKICNENQLIFNELHSTIMQTVEKAFICMEKRFPRLTSVDDFNPQLVSLIVSAICVLHNFTIIKNDNCDLYL